MSRSYHKNFSGIIPFVYDYFITAHTSCFSMLALSAYTVVTEKVQNKIARKCSSILCNIVVTDGTKQ